MTTHTEIKEIIGANMRRLRGERAVAELCVKAGISSRAFWYDLERGLKAASQAMLERIAYALGVTVRDLLEEPETVYAQGSAKKPAKRRRSA